jgi:hypothetical protein
MITKRKFFIASSGELSTERDLAELLIRRKNSSTIDNGLYLDVSRWEEMLLTYNKTRLQERFSTEVADCDVVLVLFHKRIGKFTKEEFDIAYDSFNNGLNPRHILVYFKSIIDANSLDDIDPELLAIRQSLKRKIHKDEQMYIDYQTLSDFENHFSKQLTLLINQMEREIGYINFSDTIIMEEINEMPPTKEEGSKILSINELTQLAKNIGLFNNWKTNPHLTFEKGDILYFKEKRESKARIEAQFRARALILNMLDEYNVEIAEPGDLSEKSKPIELQLLRYWRNKINNN